MDLELLDEWLLFLFPGLELVFGGITCKLLGELSEPSYLADSGMRRSKGFEVVVWAMLWGGGVSGSLDS